MPAKRMRVFAGPNGSGKTTIFKGLLQEKKINLGVYVNADDIEQELSNSTRLHFDKYHLIISNNDLKEFFKASYFSPVKRAEPDLWKKLMVKDNTLRVETKIDSYLAADLAEFLRQRLLNDGVSFTYETVMSHESKVDFLVKAKQNGYKVYLYYIATEDPDINSNRVNVRVAQKGHAVAPEIIKNRYYKSLHNLKAAVKNSSRAYIFDNSGEQAKLIAEITEGSDVLMNEVADIPNWVVEYLLKDQIF
jgi:predicted ABC-type ATPase